jgi:hypothetical protein
MAMVAAASIESKGQALGTSASTRLPIDRDNTHSQLIRRPLFCSSSQDRRGLKYSAMAQVGMSSPVVSFKTCEAHFFISPRRW